MRQPMRQALQLAASDAQLSITCDGIILDIDSPAFLAQNLQSFQDIYS